MSASRSCWRAGLRSSVGADQVAHDSLILVADSQAPLVDCGDSGLRLWITALERVPSRQSRVMQPKPLSPWIRDLATVTALTANGLNRQTIRRRVKRGTWLEPLPGVICRVTGTPTDEQRLLAALAYGGDGACLSHASAGSFWGLAKRQDQVHITVAHGHHLKSTATVAVHQTTDGLSLGTSTTCRSLRRREPSSTCVLRSPTSMPRATSWAVPSNLSA